MGMDTEREEDLEEINISKLTTRSTPYSDPTERRGYKRHKLYPIVTGKNIPLNLAEFVEPIKRKRKQDMSACTTLALASSQRTVLQ